MKATTYCDSETREVACFREDEVELELAWIKAHPAAVHTGTQELPPHLSRLKAPIPFDKPADGR